ncbi:YbhB/YbcL family Raf kinase inhibitor-like protein [Variovorax sp. RB2P76]|uniref:YbhB/YbcL family Raf kinase inhibitor-like protein n=1 Tax=Variovorax sp. RB2P76 TaxID=3443736 RepID=UPI003F490390
MLEKLPDVIGHALHGVRAGLDEIVFNTLGLREGMASIEITSAAFVDHGPLPTRCTADAPEGEGVSPPLRWTGLPAGTASLLLIVEDADSPTPNPLVHAIVVDLPLTDGLLVEAAIPSPGNEGTALNVGRNSALQAAWLPPDPPPGHGVHRYAFQLFALGQAPDFSDSPGRDEVVEALRAHAIASGLLIGTHERPDGSIKIEDAVVTSSGPLAPAAG